MITDEQLLQYNRQGLIPGPGEKEQEFLHRAEHCLRLKQELALRLENMLPGACAEADTQLYLQEAYPVLQFFCDLTPDWVPVVFHSYRLAPWHGGCAWVVQWEKDSPTVAFLQLQRTWKIKQTYLNMYTREELLAHELSHVGRMAFNEPKFEEILAYRTAPSAFRRGYGAVMQSPAEALAFVGSLLFCVALTPYSAFYGGVSWLLLPLGLAVLGMMRLRRRKKQLAACLLCLKKMVQKEQHANAVVYRLTDREIISFSTMTPDQVFAYAKAQTHSLRWRLIRLAYLGAEQSP